MNRIYYLEKEIDALKTNLRSKEKELKKLKETQLEPEKDVVEPAYIVPFELDLNNSTKIGSLPKWAIERYSRQILLPDIGVEGQERLCRAKVLVVGAGGLGCPAAAYLAGAGVGEIGIVDSDRVDVTNIHRQILHAESDQNMNKAVSAANSLKMINSRIKVTAHEQRICTLSALHLLGQYDVVLDCTDNVATRYLLGDACALLKLPLVSGSALKMEGQLSVYSYTADKNTNEKDNTLVGPCYRCVFPTPPPLETVGSCSTHGVAGPVPGMIGCLQALEAIKLISGQTHERLLVGRMFIFDGDDMTVRTVKLRPRNLQCRACSGDPTLEDLLDYETFCTARAKEEKKEDARLKSQRRREEKLKRMTGRSYFGFRSTPTPEKQKKRWIQDVPKSERKMGTACTSEFCAKGTSRFCSEISVEKRRETFTYFWNELDWGGKRDYVRRLVDTVQPKRRRIVHKGEVSRKGDSRIYHLYIREERLPVCRVMFLNTLGIKEAMVRCWLTNEIKPKAARTPLKALNVKSYIDNLPKIPPKCDICRATDKTEYIVIDNIKNIFQLYNKYACDMKLINVSPASRKTFSKVIAAKNLRIFKPKNDSDVCDLVMQHNSDGTQYQTLDRSLNDFNLNSYYSGQW